MCVSLVHAPPVNRKPLTTVVRRDESVEAKCAIQRTRVGATRDRTRDDNSPEYGEPPHDHTALRKVRALRGVMDQLSNTKREHRLQFDIRAYAHIYIYVYTVARAKILVLLEMHATRHKKYISTL